MKQLYKRFISDTPIFWKKVQALGASMIFAGALLKQIHVAPAFIEIITTWLCYNGPLVMFISQFATITTNLTKAAKTGSVPELHAVPERSAA